MRSKQELQKMGITLDMVTKSMHRCERAIARFNKIYEYGEIQCSPGDQRKIDIIMRMWDVMKQHRDILKT